MATKRVSPGGALLRASRMWSLPNPIPPPPENSTGPTTSDTATPPFPTHQIITTLSGARKQGDWGLKRPLPLRTTVKTTHPMIRVKEMDSIEMVTDFSSATDLGMTLRKFQELHLPVTLRLSDPSAMTNLNLPQRSVFDDEIDFTSGSAKKLAEKRDQRWKFNGPWLAGMTQGEFQKWLIKEVRPKRAAFREFLKEKIAKGLMGKEAAENFEKGDFNKTVKTIRPQDVTEEQLTDGLRKLRHNNQELFDMVGQFLDLAPLAPPSTSASLLSATSTTRLIYRDTQNPYAEHGPPITHPSAGISYLRTSMYMENHPIYGPQRHHTPVVARIVSPRRPTQARPARLGVAGFIVNTPLGDTASNQKTAAAAIYDRIDPAVEGGAKTWVLPQRASVDSSGRIQLTVGDASAEAVLIAQELLGDAEVLKAERDEERAQSASDIRRRYSATWKPQPTMSSAGSYGLRR